MLLPTRRSHSQVETGWVYSVRSAHNERYEKTEECWRGLVSQPEAGWFPLFSCQGLLTRTFTTALQKYITITSILPRQEEREAEETRECVCLDESERGVEAWDVRGNEAEEEREKRKKKRRARRAQARESTRWMPRR